jgi:hypothetical protein
LGGNFRRFRFGLTTEGQGVRQLPAASQGVIKQSLATDALMEGQLHIGRLKVNLQENYA